ncbi:ATP-binding protein [Zoogloea sp. LCSB751]|uniref:ATP-binding protein n=1 Tax=Zoogloea sp. LCSB751 TaxID=1965277 RepID=UPI0020B14C41|nr:ATP-binding protein [Zoogloea sp. LCSB751]
MPASSSLPAPENPAHPASRVPSSIRNRGWWLLLLAVWFAATALSLYSHGEQIRQQTTAVAIEGARNMFRSVLLARNWNASHGGVYVPVTPQTQPNPYLHVPNRDVITSDGQQLTLVNPAYMTRLIGETAESSSGAVFRLTSLKPLRPGNAPDPWEAEALRAFEGGAREYIGSAKGPDGNMLRFMAPLKVEPSCLQCHGNQGYQVGDIRGGLSVSQRQQPIEDAVAAGIRDSLLTHGAVFLFGTAVGWLLLEQLRRRWLELDDKVRELQTTQGQLLQSEKMAAIGQLAAGVAHEINNPVSFVSSNMGTLKRYSESIVELLERCRRGEAIQADYDAIDFDYLKTDIVDLLHESSDGLARVKKIVADLKDFSHVDRAEWQDADLNAGIDSTLNVVAHELKYRAEVLRDFGPLPPVPCIAAQINQVVMNLVVNAAQAIENHGTITIRTHSDEDHARIEISDTGKGMPTEVLKRIFEPFYTTKPVGKGTGLGLSLSYDIIKKHGGNIEVSSEVGVGSTFVVSLPLRSPHVQGDAGGTPQP